MSVQGVREQGDYICKLDATKWLDSSHFSPPTRVVFFFASKARFEDRVEGARGTNATAAGGG